MEKYDKPIKGRGAGANTPNPYQDQYYDTEVDDGLDELLEPSTHTQILNESAKKIINKVSSPDVPMDYSINPYQGCEHGCIYCYARNAHHYWGMSAGLDFERKIIAKRNAADLLRNEFMHKQWSAAPIMFSGNTDCYQPIERKLELTRACLKVIQEFRNPVGIITKNQLILRDLDILQDLADDQLIRVFITITSLDHKLRRLMEPRTSSAVNRFKTIEQLSIKGIPVGVMVGPVIPGLNNHEIHEILKQAANHGAMTAGYTLVRLNGSVKELFSQWIYEHYPDKAEKVLNQIKDCHDGSLNDSRFGKRMRGAGPLADSISSFFKLEKKRWFKDKSLPPYNLEKFQRPGENQLSLFDS